MLKIYNTLSKKKEIFVPINTGKINMYVCGVTVYDLCHIGHARTFIAFDVIIRYLRYIGYQVTYVRNITDIDDKIIKKSIEQNIKYSTLTKIMLNNMHKDFDDLNILRADFEPKATNHINDIINMIEILINKNYAYIANNGDVMFAVNKKLKYGILSRQNLNNLYTNNNQTNNIKNKIHPTDFVLWKKSKINEPNWSSPWGLGRPGWHIECSAMSHNKFGKHFDIHGGGIDLVFPHHENEIAQSTAAYETPYVNYWLHTGMVMLEKEKMSKSSNNFITIRNALKQFEPEILRYLLVSHHYRYPLYYTNQNIKLAELAIKKIYVALQNINVDDIHYTKNTIFKKNFTDAMNDDFNTPKACSILFKIIKEINRLDHINKSAADELRIELYSLSNILGIIKRKPRLFWKKNNHILYHKNNIAIIKLISERDCARKNKDWKTADVIRNKLLSMGVILEDNKNNTLWKYK
uniref:Cysteine--tRNA ligase n=1 Tax=Candidatus Aschnera chinzeii TaxID=1485666 RepID=A0AAT9G3R5_9ENTR|nr:MAG: cysteine--tRNA ligase [Candidatus Aschnera chinzeii]